MIIEVAAALYIGLAIERRLERVPWMRDRWSKTRRWTRGRLQ